jgi:hypothetical protein
MGAGSSTTNSHEQWEQEVVKGRGLGVGAGNVVRRSTADERERVHEEEEMKKVNEIVHRHSMLKQDDRAMRAEEKEDFPEVDDEEDKKQEEEEKLLHKGPSYGASQHSQLLMNLKADSRDEAGRKANAPKVGDCGELRARIALDSTYNKLFNPTDVEMEAHALEKCFAGIALGLGLMEGQFDTRVVDALVEDVENVDADSSSDESNGGNQQQQQQQHNRLVFQLTVSFFASEEGFSGPFVEKMHAFLGYAKSSSSKEEDEPSNCNSSRWGDEPQWVLSQTAAEPAPICAEFARMCEAQYPKCAVRVGRVHRASLNLVSREKDAHHHHHHNNNTAPPSSP